MKKLIYIEKEIHNNKRVTDFISRFSNVDIIYIDKYTEVFNKKNQNFKLQKKNPAIILARKYKNFLKEIPSKYSIGNRVNYYFSYMYNCLFDCKYCFLQGLYNSANYVIFINYEDYFEEIKNLTERFSNEKLTIFSGYDCDSLAYDSHTGFVEKALNFFLENKNFDLELRTKSTFIKPLIRKSITNVIVAYSFTPSNFSKAYEKGVPSVEKRMSSIKKLVELGWKIGLRFDPFIVYEGWERDYKELFNKLFKLIPKNLMHSVTYGNLRYPTSHFKKIYKNNTDEELFFNLKNNNMMYEDIHKERISNFCKEQLMKYIEKKKIFQNY